MRISSAFVKLRSINFTISDTDMIEQRISADVVEMPMSVDHSYRTSCDGFYCDPIIMIQTTNVLNT